MPSLQIQSEQNKPEPKASRPYVPGYGIPASIKGTLSWSHVGERMEKSRN